MIKKIINLKNTTMKAILKIVFLLVCISTFGQEQKTDYKKINNDLVKATYYFADNASIIEREGFFNKEGKLQGLWVTYNLEGDKTAIANYNNGEKEGVWQYLSKEKISFVTYKNNKIINVEEKALVVN